MKKNKFMRLASILLVAVLLSTCAISGTFAKYTTTTTGSDSARVAIWDITADFETADSDSDKMFKAVYGATVDSNDDDQVVAPGTKDNYTYSMTGAPEVDYVVSFTIDSYTDLTLKAGTYTFTDPYQDMTVTTATDYLPLKWKVTISTTNGTLKDTAVATKFVAGTAREFASLAEIQTALSYVTVEFDANETCDVDVKIEWEWLFTNSNVTDADKMDTVLGYYVKKAEASSFVLPFTTTAETAVTNVAYDFSMTATQVD